MPRRLLRLENNLRHGETRNVSNRKVGMNSPQLAKEFCSLAVKSQGWTSCRNSRHLNILPTDASVPSGTDGFQGSLFGGKTRGVAFCLVCFGFAVADLLGSENPLQEPPAEALYRRGDPANLSYVNACSNNH